METCSSGAICWMMILLFITVLHEQLLMENSTLKHIEYLYFELFVICIVILVLVDAVL